MCQIGVQIVILVCMRDALNEWLVTHLALAVVFGLTSSYLVEKQARTFFLVGIVNDKEQRNIFAELGRVLPGFAIER